MSKKWVYLFHEVEEAEKLTGSWDGVRGLLGGKGANLAEMTRIGVPVPPGFIVTTEACNAYIAGGDKFPAGCWDQILAGLKATEEATGKNVRRRTNPLLVSCRSGAKFSMPGMMDTVLNIGLNDVTAQGMVRLSGNETFVYNSYRRLRADVRLRSARHPRRAVRGGDRRAQEATRASRTIPSWARKTGRH